MAEVDQYAYEVGKRIRQARLETEGGPLKQKELADLIQVSERSMSAYETGDVIPYFKMADIAAITGKSIAWILHGEKALETPGELAPILEDIRDVLGKILERINK